MGRRFRTFWLVAAASVAMAPSLAAQQRAWQAETNPQARPSQPPATQSPVNTTVVPRSAPDAKAAPAPAGGPAQVSFVALLTDDGQFIEQGLEWRVYREKPGPDGKPQLVVSSKEASPSLSLPAGTYLANVAFGRANLTRKITVASGRAAQERFVLNAGGLRVTATLASGEAISDRPVVYDIYSDERDQYGQRTKLASSVRAGLVVRLNAGIYNIVSSYGDANAVARADVTVEAGKLSEATLAHAAARVTFKLVTRRGGDAIADTQWNLANAQGETVKESVGALPTHVLAPGIYTASARNGGEVFQHRFSVQAGDVVQVEVLRR